MASADPLSSPDTDAGTLFSGPGEMRARCRTLDWSATPLGPVSEWPPSLRTAVDVCLGATLPSFVWWGPELIQLYNDAALDMVRAKHPALLGAPARTAWGDVWTTVGALIERILATGEAVRAYDLPMEPERGGARETATFTFSSSPVHDEAGRVAGVYCTAIETTDRVRAEATLRESEQRLRRHARWASGQSDAFRAAMDDAPLESSLGILVRTAVELAGGDCRCAFYIVDAAGCGLRHVVGMPESYAESVDGDPASPESLACGVAVATGEPVFTPDIVQEERWEPWAWLARDHGYRAFWSTPIETSARSLVGAVAMYFAEPREPTALDREQVAALAGTAAIIISRFLETDERAQFEAALHEAQERLEEALAVSRMAYWSQDASTGETVASESMEDLFGLEPGERFRSSEARFAIVHVEDRARHRAIVEGAAARGDGWHTEYRIVRPRDGRVVWLEERATVSHDPVTGATSTTGLVWDVTDRKRAESAAEHERAARDRDVLRRELATAEEAERRRLAREVHDRLGQHLAALSLGLDAVRRIVRKRASVEADRESLRITVQLRSLQELATTLTTDAHNLALELRPPELDDVGFASALETHIAEWSARYGIATEVEITGLEHERPLASEVASSLYRIAQEALTNVARHAHATQVSVVVDQLDDDVRLIVEDDGCGFDVDRVRERARLERRLGLAGVQERAALVGGTLTIESTPGSGTTLYVRLPMEHRSSPEPAEPAGSSHAGHAAVPASDQREPMDGE